MTIPLPSLALEDHGLLAGVHVPDVDHVVLAGHGQDVRPARVPDEVVGLRRMRERGEQPGASRETTWTVLPSFARIASFEPSGL